MLIMCVCVVMCFISYFAKRKKMCARVCISKLLKKIKQGTMFVKEYFLYYITLCNILYYIRIVVFNTSTLLLLLFYQQ